MNLKEEKQKASSLKHTLYQRTEEWKREHKARKELENELEAARARIQELEQANEQFQRQTSIKEAGYKKQITRLNHTLGKSKRTIENLEGRIHGLEKRTDVSYAIEQAERNRKLEQTNTSLRKRNELLEEEVDRLKKTNHRLFRRLRSAAQNYPNRTPRDSTPPPSRKPVTTRTRSPKKTLKPDRYGYASHMGTGWFYRDIRQSSDQETDWRPIQNAEVEPFAERLTEGAPVRVYLTNEGHAMLTHVYQASKKGEGTSRVVKPKAHAKALVPIPPDLHGTGKVLIVGSRFLSHYQSGMQRAGYEVETFNPYEENLHLLEGKAHQADIVFVCTSHVSHNSLDHIPKDPKVELIEHDSLMTLLLRACAMNQYGNVIRPRT